MKKEIFMNILYVCMIILSIFGIALCLYYYFYGLNDNHFILVSEISGGTDIIEFQEYTLVPNEKYENYVLIKSSISTKININISAEVYNDYKQIVKDNLNLIIIFNDKKIYEDKFIEFMNTENFNFDSYVIQDEENILKFIYFMDDIDNTSQQQKLDFTFIVNVKNQ